MGEVANNNDALFQRIATLIEESRQRVKTAINTAMVYTYYNVGRYIVEDEQQGKQRAEYGKALLKDLSVKLTEQFGEGWSYAQLKNIKQFYLVFSKRLNTVEPFCLSWSHYLILMRIDNPDARSFYEIEC